MTNEDFWAVAAAFADIFATTSPPTHSDMDLAFRRAGVSSPQGSGFPSISKSRRITNAFDDAEDKAPDRTSSLIKALTSALATKRVFEESDVVTQQMLTRLRADLARIGWKLSDAGELSPLGTIEVQTGGREALDQQLKRLRNSSDDVSLMLGASKDALEAAAKFVLEERHQTFRPDEPVEALVNRAMKLAEISVRPTDASNESSKALATFAQTVPKIAEAVRKVRNDQGSGHGRTAVASLSLAEASFVRDLTLSVVNFLISEHQARSWGL